MNPNLLGHPSTQLYRDYISSFELVFIYHAFGLWLLGTWRQRSNTTVGCFGTKPSPNLG